jgi:hypothetical protein
MISQPVNIDACATAAGSGIIPASGRGNIPAFAFPKK